MINNIALKVAYTAMAAIAGAVTSLSLTKWKEMTTPEIVMALFVGASFAVFFTPWFLHSIIRVDEGDVRTISFITYISASGSNILIPIAIKYVGKFVGAGDPK